MDSSESKSFFPHPEAPIPSDPLDIKVTGLGIMVDYYVKRAGRAKKDESAKIFDQITIKRDVFVQALNSKEHAMHAVEMLSSLTSSKGATRWHREARKEFIEGIVDENSERIEELINSESLKESAACLNLLNFGLKDKNGEKLAQIFERQIEIIHKLYENGDETGHNLLILEAYIPSLIPGTIEYLGGLVKNNKKLRTRVLRDLNSYTINKENLVLPQLIRNKREIFEGFFAYNANDMFSTNPYHDAVFSMFASKDPAILEDIQLLIEVKIKSVAPENALRLLNDIRHSPQIPKEKAELLLKKSRGLILDLARDPNLKASELLWLIDGDVFEDDKEIQGMRVKVAERKYEYRVVELRSFGLDPDELFSIWADCAPSGTRYEGFYDIFGYNMMSILNLEEKEKGITKFLNDNYGIANFARYPEELLLKQYRERDNGEAPYGLVVYPLNDWNGAFTTDKNMLEGLESQLEGKYLLRVAEVGGSYTLAKALRKMYKKYGKISFVIMGGHGTEFSVQFGDPNMRYGLMQATDLRGEGARKIGEVFIENPTIILEACSTGRFSGGMAGMLSHILRADVIAPKVDTSIKSIDVQFDEKGKPIFDVAYGNEGEDVRFVNGS